MSAGGQNVVADLIHQPISSWEEFEAIYECALSSIYINIFSFSDLQLRSLIALLRKHVKLPPQS